MKFYCSFWRKNYYKLFKIKRNRVERF